MAMAIAMVMLSEDSPLEAAEVQRELFARWPDLPAATETDERDETIAFALEDAQIILGKMPAPIPWSELESPCATSILWPSASEEVKQHKLHWIVTLSAELDPVPLSTLLTQVTSAVMAACHAALGVYWGGATLIIPKDLFIEFAEKVLPLGPPVEIWIDVRVGKDSEKSTSGFSTGMAALGHLEFEAVRSPEPPGELRERISALARYVLEHGPVIKDGDTVGEDVHERIRVVYSKSAFGQSGPVMRLEYETSSKKNPWWKLWN